MKILNIISNSPTRIPIIPKIFWTEISAMIEISTNFDPHAIIEFQIYSFILPILEAILDKNVAKTIQKFYQYEKSVKTDVFKNFKLKLLRNFSPTHNQTLFLILCLPHRRFHHPNIEQTVGLNSHQYLPRPRISLVKATI